MSLPQLRAVLDACDRRDASLGVQMLDTVHSAVAPLMAGEKGAPAFERCLNYLKDIISPPTPEERKKNSVFGKLWALAMANKAELEAKAKKQV